MAASIIESLRDELIDGLSIVSRIWEYKTRNWVTCINAVDIDGDGDVEIIIGSRDGRVYCLSKTGKLRWKREIGTRAWIVTIFVSGPAIPGKEVSVRIIVGTRDGKVYVLDSEGRMITKDNRTLLFDEEGKALDTKLALQAYWFNCEYVIRSIYVDPQLQSQIVIGTEDRGAYGLDFRTGKFLWRYQTAGWVRTVFLCDINKDGQDEVICGSVDGNLYLLNLQGQLLLQYAVGHPIRTIFVEDIDQDENIEVLVSTNHKNLVSLVYRDGMFEKKWERGPFENRLLTLYVTDIDKDGAKEIISGSEDKHIYILDANGNTLWRHNHKNRIFDIATPDIDNDGLPELLIGGENKRVRAMNVRLRRGIEEKIHKYYARLRKSDQLTLPQLNVKERALLQDVLGLNTRPLVKFKQAKRQMEASAYEKALIILLKLQEQKVEQLWCKDDIEYIRTVCFRHTTKETGREIIIGTANGGIYAFYVNGHDAGSTHLNDHIMDVQTGFIDHHKKEEIIICSSGHHIYILGDEKDTLRKTHIADMWMSSICVRAASNQNQSEIIVGSEDKKLSIYRNNLQNPVAVIPMEEGARIVRAQPPTDKNIPEIVVGSLGNRIHAYKRDGRCLWSYPTYDRIKAICIKDINGDGQAEILVGSEDRNIHVLDSAGRLLWRYYLPHSALTIDAADVNRDGMVKVFVGCADGILYVFNRCGDLLWTYQAKDRIHSVCVEDIDGDGNFEIAIGSEDEFELLRVVNQQQITNAIAQCWVALCHESSNAIASLLASQQPLLQAFAVKKLVEQGNLQSRDFDAFEQIIAESPSQVRKELARLVPLFYQLNLTRSRGLLRQLSTDIDFEVRNVMIEQLPTLMNYDWEEGFYYLKHAAENSSRFVRRIALRKVDNLITISATTLMDKERRHQIFALLLSAAQDKDSEWVRQEAARTLAHFLELHQGSLIVYIHLFIVKDLHTHVWEQIAYTTKNAVVKRYITSVIPMLSGLNQDNVQERLRCMIHAQDAAVNLLYGNDLLLSYRELHHLFTLETLEDIASYQCLLQAGQFSPKNQFARNILTVLEKLLMISRPLKMYFRREDLQDRLTSLLEAIAANNRMYEHLEQQYSTILLTEPMRKLPDHQVFLLLLKKWQGLMQAQLNELRGRAELKLILPARDVRKEEQVGIWVTVQNTGRSSANDVKITLLRGEYFEVVGNNSFETEVIPPGEETTTEFILKPYNTPLKLKFEVIYYDADTVEQVEWFEDCIELREGTQQFRLIPNPYSTGTPTHNGDLFYGREKDKAFLQDNLTRDVKSVVVLYGQRRSGKTSLLVRLNKSSILGEHIPVLIDMQRTSYNMTINSFLRRVASYIERSMKRKGIFVTAPEPGSFEIDAIHAFDVFLDQVEELLVGRKLILLIDEFEILEEQVTKGKLQPEIFEYLRDIVQHRENINFLFSGTHKITEYTRWYRSVFFNIAIHHRLSRLIPEDAEALIKKPVEGYLEYEPLTMQKIRLLTADQPYLIHLMCRAIVDYCNEQQKNYVTINDVNTVLREVMKTGRYHFDWLWDQIKPDERVVLAAISECSKEEGRWLPLGELEETYRRFRISYKDKHLLDALKLLIEADIVESEQDDVRKSRFRIPVGLTRGWMLKEHPLNVVCKEMNS